jgi:hypothetical protein
LPQVDEGATALAKKLQNPIADLISIPFQNNPNFSFAPKKDIQNILSFRPVVVVPSQRRLEPDRR